MLLEVLTLAFVIWVVASTYMEGSGRKKAQLLAIMILIPNMRS